MAEDSSPCMLWMGAHRRIRAEGDVHDSAWHVEKAGRQPGSTLHRPLCMLQRRNIKQHHFVGCIAYCNRPAVWSEGNGCHRASILHKQNYFKPALLVTPTLQRQKILLPIYDKDAELLQSQQLTHPACAWDTIVKQCLSRALQ